MTDDDIEQEIQAKRLTAPRVTPEDLDANIRHVDIVTYVGPRGQTLRWAVIETASGFLVPGKPSASVSPENDDEELGVKIAVDNARNELWPLMGYALKEQLNKE